MNWWNSYWFRPAPLLDLVILRIMAVGLQLWLLMLYHYNLMEFLRERASLFLRMKLQETVKWPTM